MSSQYKDFFYNGNFDIRRKRVLDQPETISQSLLSQESDRRDLAEQYINGVYKSYERASDKANIIMIYAAKVANKYTIPVAKESTEIRQALSRSGSKTEDFITFELFQRCIEVIEKQATSVDFSVINTKVDADPLAAERQIKKALDSRLSNDSLSPLLLIGAQIMVLYSIHTITGIFRSPETAAAGATLPTAIEEAFRQLVNGIAASFVILGVNNTLAFLQANTDQNDKLKSYINGAIAEAKQIKLPPLIENIRTVLGLEDHKIILQYCLSYIAKTQEKGYEFWYAYFISRKIRYLSKRSRSLAPLFSKNIYSQTNNLYNTDGAIVNPDNILLNAAQNTLGNDIFEGIASNIVNLLNKSVVYPSDIYLCAQDFESSQFENALNRIAQVLDTKLSRDAVCCFIRFFGNIDVDILKKIRALLMIYQNTHLIDLDATLKNFESYLLSWVRDTIVRLIMALINAILDKIVKLITDFLKDLRIDIDTLAECPLILELIQSILDAINSIMRDLEEIVNNYIKLVVYNIKILAGYENTNKRAAPSFYRIHRKRIIGQILRILNSIISTVEAGTILCDDKQSNNSITYDQVLDSPLVKNLDEYLNIPQDVKDSYFKDATEVKLQDGTTIPSYKDGIIDIQTNDDCISLLNRYVPSGILDKYARS